ncbi:MAG: nucleotidyltransferase family protein [Ginsengibacter sp.]|jgi:D-glycero-alpha-D-manno-heptose 1-phosphate guanylyltransferase
MIKEAIILAGGLGTRLRSVITDLPKCMAPVAGKPFIYYVIEFLKNNGVTHFIFSVGYLHEVIEKYLQENYTHINYTLSIEDEPLGTGGAIKLACNKALEKDVLICNGDTLYKIDVLAFSKFHQEKKSTCTLSLKPMQNFDRYGVVEINEEGNIQLFKEKQFYQSGLINGGLYALDVEEFLNEKFPERFSFEKEYLEQKVLAISLEKSGMFGMIQDAYFIDIGIPEDYEKAQQDLAEKL